MKDLPNKFSFYYSGTSELLNVAERIDSTTYNIQWHPAHVATGKVTWRVCEEDEIACWLGENDGWVLVEDLDGEEFKEVPQPTEDAVNNPKHYTSHPSGIECLDVTRHMSFNLGNATKYIWRCDLKKDAIEDLRKAIFYLNDEINLRLSKKEC